MTTHSKTIGAIQSSACLLLFLGGMALPRSEMAAQVLTLTPTEAFRILTENTAWHDPNYVSVYTHPESQNVQRSILSFDLAAIPAGAHVDSAMLSIERLGFYTQEPPAQSEVHALVRSWDSSASWATASSGVPWSSPGGDYSPAAYAINAALINGPDHEQVNWDVTSLVADWASGSLPNYGMLLLGTSGNSLHFYPATSKLSVNYTPVPEPQVVGLAVGLGLLGFGLGRRFLGSK